MTKIKTHNINRFIQINNDNLDFPLVAYYMATYEEYPSAYQIRDHFDVSKIYKALFEKFKVNEKDIIGLRAKDMQGRIAFEDMVCPIGDKFLIRIYNQTGVTKSTRRNRLYYEDASQTEDEINSNLDCAELIIDIAYDNFSVDFSEIKALEDFVSQFKLKPVKRGQINIVVNNQVEGMHLKEFKIKNNSIDLELNYGSNFKEIHEIIFNGLNSKDNSKGLVLLYGDPGTGKTSYIRHLINTIEEKKVIYLTPDLAGMISDPSFVTFLMDHPNSILVIEDGESILRSRKSGANQSVANLLNLADGLLSDALNMQIVCTFNCDIGDVDSALLRKGRLIAKHEFKKLSKEDAQKVSDSLGFDSKISKEMSLADIYNQKTKDFEETKEVNKIGFGK